MTPNVAVLAFDGVVLGDLSIPCEMFKRAGYEVRVCSPKPLVQTELLQLMVPWRLASLSWAQTIVVPGIDDLEREVPQAMLRALQRAFKRGARIASICTGAFILARAGLLNELRATTHWMAAKELSRRHPGIEVDAGVLYVDNERVLTSAGAAAGLDLCLHMVRCDLGAEAASGVARAAVMPLERSGGQAQFIVHEAPDDCGSIQPLLTWLEKNLHRPLTIPMIARRGAMSTRTLNRRFREQTGTTPARWVNEARVRRAQRLLEVTSLSVERVAAEVGFGSTAVLRERFGLMVGTSPQGYRRAFQRA